VHRRAVIVITPDQVDDRQMKIFLHTNIVTKTYTRILQDLLQTRSKERKGRVFV